MLRTLNAELTTTNNSHIELTSDLWMMFQLKGPFKARYAQLIEHSQIALDSHSTTIFVHHCLMVKHG